MEHRLWTRCPSCKSDNVANGRGQFVMQFAVLGSITNVHELFQYAISGPGCTSRARRTLLFEHRELITANHAV
jgi:hypothetical protein